MVITPGNNVDFNSTAQTAVITAGTSSTTVNITVISDTIVEGDEMFAVNLNVPSSLPTGILAGDTIMATVTIIDTSSTCVCYMHTSLYWLIICVEITVSFTQSQFNGSEFLGIMIVSLGLDGGRSTSPFNATITPSEQSPVSAESNLELRVNS